MWQHLLLLLLLQHFGKGTSTERCKPNIAIIGGGIGGASTSHFLAEMFDGNLKIDLYEAKNIGGRLATVQINENEYEAGGSIIHSQNKYMQEFVKFLGLEHRSSSDQTAGIWNGDEFVFEESSWEAISLMKLLYRYGVQPFKLNRYISTVLDDFRKIYNLQDAKKSFMNVTGFLEAMNADFPKLQEISIEDHLLSLGYKERFIHELVKTTLVVNYGQDTNVQSFVGCVSLAGVGSELWAVKGGNKKVPEHLIYRNKNVNVIPSYVRTIRHLPTKNNGSLYEVYYTNKDSTNLMKSVYNIVILATPLTSDQEFPITFDGIPPNDIQINGNYHKTIATFVKGDLKPRYFGLEEELDIILSCDPNKTIISSIGRLDTVEGLVKGDNRVWKIFSNIPLKPEFISEMFENVDEVKEIIWKAYPEYSTDARFDKFKLHDGIYYVNAIEWAASAMEMSAIAGRNVAILAHEDFCQKCLSQKTETNLDDAEINTPSSDL